MKIIVLLKQVPDMESVKFDSERGVIDRSSATTEINPFDLNALEAAVEIAEEVEGEVIAISMGLPSAEDALREALGRGASRGILLNDRKFGGSDVKATSNTLAAGIKKIGEFDLIIAGMQTVDGDTGQVGAEVAELLAIPQISYVEKLNEFDSETLTVTTNIWEGLYLKKAKYPLLITVTKDINVPRLPSFKDKMKARKAEIEVWGEDELKDYLREDQIGLKGSATKVKRIEVPKAVLREGKLWRENQSEAVDAVIDLFKEKKVLEV